METTQANTALSAQEQQLAKAKSNAEKKFDLVVAETAEVVKQCKAIVITSGTELAMANQILSKANSALKQSEEKRKEINKPYQDQITFVNEFVKTKINFPLSEAIEFGKNKLREWNETETKRANALKDEDTKRFTFLKTCEANMQKQVGLCDTPDKCDKLIGVINAQWPSNDKFGNYVSEATATKANFITLLTTKKKALAGALSNDIAEVVENVEKENEVIAEQQEVDLVIDEKKDIIQSSMQPELGAVRRTWKFIVVDELKLPREFLSVDDAKVKAYMNANKDKFEESGTIKNGVRFFRDSAPQIR